MLWYLIAYIYVYMRTPLDEMLNMGEGRGLQERLHWISLLFCCFPAVYHLWLQEEQTGLHQQSRTFSPLFFGMMGFEKKKVFALVCFTILIYFISSSIKPCVGNALGVSLAKFLPQSLFSAKQMAFFSSFTVFTHFFPNVLDGLHLFFISSVGSFRSEV
ncbi:hypothetical protein ABB37_00687 [Leptomonas pyrrhocoris]|uniref:Uncharacterized protein n=1 Tax=Leptomonas pyrrhocoris TaxID=157538 RepID=A0A0M9GAY3_LEPPY|nr:hypothetical protein ABB37_00687 [Leptomonas pyrrhocoris]KPA86547.1 hypothetical protein ABB37_00687 [Leptomonas pyrrhocoris]|eukprot:XP_015664986.1 hypothetical protein ABB37_00687 [Leptomonas pyrrhocoris]